MTGERKGKAIRKKVRFRSRLFSYDPYRFFHIHQFSIVFTVCQLAAVINMVKHFSLHTDTHRHIIFTIHYIVIMSVRVNKTLFLFSLSLWDPAVDLKRYVINFLIFSVYKTCLCTSLIFVCILDKLIGTRCIITMLVVARDKKNNDKYGKKQFFSTYFIVQIKIKFKDQTFYLN